MGNKNTRTIPIQEHDHEKQSTVNDTHNDKNYKYISNETNPSNHAISTPLPASIKSLPYITKLQLLSSGYARNIMSKSQELPTVITNECALFIKGEHEISFRKWMYDYSDLPLEIQLKPLDGIAALVSHTDISKYEIKYIERSKNDFTSEDFSDVKTFITSNIYDYNCLSFTGWNEVHTTGGNVMVKVIAYDKNENILCESDWKEFYVNVASVTHHGDDFDYGKLNVFFSSKIDVNGRGCVNVDEWVKGCTRGEIGFIGDMDKKFFYWMCYMFARDNEKNEITARELSRAVCIDDFEEYIYDYMFSITEFHRAMGHVTRY